MNYFSIAIGLLLVVDTFGIALLHRAIRIIMSDIDTLNAALATISDTVDAIATDTSTIGTEVSALEAELQQLQNNNPTVDLSSALATAASVSSRLSAIKGSLDSIAEAAGTTGNDTGPAASGADTTEGAAQ